MRRPAMAVLDRGSPEPLYLQIADDLREQIESGGRAPGETLPTEEALREIYGVSRSVVRQALQRLAGDRLISREQGRGTVVRPAHDYRRRAGQAGGLSQQIAAVGGRLETRIVALEPTDPPTAERSRLPAGRAWRLERVRSVDGEALIHMVTWIPESLAPTLTAEGLGGGSLHEWMRANGLDPQGGPRQLHAAPAGKATALHLDVPVASPVTLLSGVTVDRSGRTLEAFSAWHHPQITFDLDAEVGQARLPVRAEKLLDELRLLIARN